MSAFAGLGLSRIGLGTWAMGGERGHGAWGPQSDTDSEATIDAALAAGVNWVDTAPVYGDGHSERLLARAVRKHGSALHVAGKCGLLPAPGNARPNPCLRADSVRRQVEDTLTRLGTQRLSLCQLHWPQPREQLEEGWMTLVRLVEEGKVGAIGVCNFDRVQLERLHRLHPVASAQFAYNLIERSRRESAFAFCREAGIAVLAYAPLRAGLLSGTMTGARLQRLALNDWRRREADFNSPMFEVNQRLIADLAPLAAELGCPLPSLCTAWVLSHDSIDAVIAGARTPAQFEQIAAALELVLPGEIRQRIARLCERRDEAARALRTRG